MKQLFAAVACAVALLGVCTAAHHSFAAEYDANQPITVSGTVTKID